MIKNLKKENKMERENQIMLRENEDKGGSRYKHTLAITFHTERSQITSKYEKDE